MSLSLDWNGDMKFSSSAGSPAIQLDSSNPEVTSPTQALAYGVMGCMAMDVVHILQKGRHDLKGLKVHFEGERHAEHPRRYVSIALRFELTGDVPEDAVARALELSHEKYCSVSNSIREDIKFTTSFKIN
jgi:putative redox protein